MSFGMQEYFFEYYNFNLGHLKIQDTFTNVYAFYVKFRVQP